MANRERSFAWAGGRRGTVLLTVIWVVMILTGILLALGYQSQLEEVLFREYQSDLACRQTALDLLQGLIYCLQVERMAYDAPGTMGYVLELPLRMGYYNARVELWDEGSRFNLNNTPTYLWQIFLQDMPEYYELLYTWFFSQGDRLFTVPAVVRQNYLFMVEELNRLPGAEIYSNFLERIIRPELTVFGPALFYLLDGETYVSLLKRAGEEYGSSLEIAIIDAFNQNRQEAMYQASLFQLLARLSLPVLPNLERLEPLITTEGLFNPNFISLRCLNALVGRPPVDSNRLYDLEALQVNNPFTNLETFNTFLREVYGEDNIPKHLPLCFTLKTRLWGVRISVKSPTRREFVLSVILEKKGSISQWKIKILSLREEWQ